MSHDPALVVMDYEWPDAASALSALSDPAGISPHGTCELVIGRYSYPLVEVCCPRFIGRSNSVLHIGAHPHKDGWIDASWLRLAVLAGQDVAWRANLPGCWTYERAKRLRLELGVDLNG